MSNSERPPSPNLEEIDDRVSDIREFLEPSDVEDLFWYLILRYREPSVKVTKVQKVALEFLAWQDARNKGGAEFHAHGVKDRYSPATIPKDIAGERKAVKARTFADKLRDKLPEYYRNKFGMPTRDLTRLDPKPSEVSAGRAEWIIYIEIPEGKGWKPIIEWRTSVINKPIAVAENTVDFECVGTNLEAMQYLAKHIPLARRVEDTAIRWDPTKLPSTELDEFRSKLKASKASYRLITGPVKYKTYMEVLREVYSENPEKKALLKCFRLDRAIPIMNFTILYYPDKSSEVLYGYGIQKGKNSVDSTMVFRTSNPDLVKEYMRLFEALRNHSSSYPISVEDPDFIDSDETESDVVRTFKKFGEISLEHFIKKGSNVEIKVCFTCTHEIDRLLKIFQDNSSYIRSIQVLLSTHDSKFLELREEALSYRLKHLIDTNIIALKQLVPKIETEIRQTRKLMPAMFFQIGSTIIFSQFWTGIPVAEGPQCMVRANSQTGIALVKQFQELWCDRENVEVLSNISQPSA